MARGRFRQSGDVTMIVRARHRPKHDPGDCQAEEDDNCTHATESNLALRLVRWIVVVRQVSIGTRRVDVCRLTPPYAGTLADAEAKVGINATSVTCEANQDLVHRKAAARMLRDGGEAVEQTLN